MEDGVLQDIKISLRYDGKDALNHEIDLNCLGESLRVSLRFSLLPHLFSNTKVQQTSYISRS